MITAYHNNTTMRRCAVGARIGRIYRGDRQNVTGDKND